MWHLNSNKETLSAKVHNLIVIPWPGGICLIYLPKPEGAGIYQANPEWP